MCICMYMFIYILNMYTVYVCIVFCVYDNLPYQETNFWTIYQKCMYRKIYCYLQTAKQFYFDSVFFVCLFKTNFLLKCYKDNGIMNTVYMSICTILYTKILIDIEGELVGKNGVLLA